MYSGSKKGPVLAALVFFLAVTSTHAQTVPSNMVAQALRSMAFSYVPEAEFNRVFQNFLRTTYPGRTSFAQFELSGVSESFVYYLVNNPNIIKEWEKYEIEAAKPAPPRFKATHKLTAELKLFTKQDGGSEVVASLTKGTAVQVESWGEYAELDKTIAKWAQVKTEDGKSGWLWSGHLEEVK